MIGSEPASNTPAGLPFASRWWANAAFSAPIAVARGVRPVECGVRRLASTP